jgi:hypothetical protein
MRCASPLRDLLAAELRSVDIDGPAWLNLVFNVAADFGEGFVQVLGSIQWRPASSIGVSRRPASSMPRPVA